MIILVTGSSGFFGKEVVRLLQGHCIYTLNRYEGNFQYDLSLSVPNFDVDFDLVIHAAGKAHIIPNSNSEIDSFFKINVQGVKNLLIGLEKRIPKKFVFISSVAVYGLEGGVNITESQSLAAKDPYGISKIQAEELIINWCCSRNVICTILRLPLLVGQNPPGNLGSMLNGINKRFYFNISGGLAKKSMVLASDVAKYILPASIIGGIFNLTDGYHPTFEELSNCISKQLGKSKPMNMPFWFAMIVAKFGDFLGNKAPLNTNKLKKITSDLTFDDNKARVAFGWKPAQVLEGFNLNDNAQ